MPGEVLYPSKKKQMALLVLCLVFAAVGTMMIMDHASGGYFCAGFGLLGCVMFVVNLLPGASYLRLDEKTFTFCSLFRAHSVDWLDVEDFGVFRLRLKKMVAWNFVAGYRGQRRMTTLSKAISGFEAALPDTYGLSAIELVERMEGLRLAALVKSARGIR
jgi:hypothetical protein